MNLSIPRKLAKIGGILIVISGIVNTVLGIRIGAIYYDIYPGSKMGHVGIIVGIIAFLIGLALILFIVPLYYRKNRRIILLGGILTLVLGHLGAIAGSIYIGTVGVILCYIAGIWTIIVTIRRPKLNPDS
jgi:uncharacterized BrkB/YihY/UPF0761 family membrane protein